MRPMPGSCSHPARACGKYFHRPLIPLLLAYMAGILAGRRLPFMPVPYFTAWALLAACAVYLVRLLLKNREARLSPLLLFSLLGLLAISARNPPFFPPADAKPFLDGRYHRLSGTVVESPRVLEKRTACILARIEIEGDTGEKKRLPGRIRAYVYGRCPELRPGDRVSIFSKLYPFKNFNNPGGFDYRRFMADRGIWAAVYTGGHDLEKLPATPRWPRLLRSVHGFRDRLDNLIAATGDGDDASAVLSALVLGKRDRISSRLREAFSRAGAAHLLAISGLHVGIVGACAFFLFTRLLARSQTLLLYGWSARGAAILSILPVVAYGLLAGMSPSTQRAVLMIAIFFAAFVQGKPYNAVNTLAAAALAIVAIYPASLFSVSFQLSFTAVGAIFLGLYLFPPADLARVRPAMRIIRRLPVFVLISACAMLGTMPLVMHHFNQVSFLGVLSNLVLVPWIGFAVVPAGLLCALIFPFSQSLCAWGLSVTHGMLKPAVCLVHVFSEFPLGAFRTVTPSVPEVVCIYLLMAAGALLVGSRRPCGKKIPAAVVGIAILAGAADAGYWIHRRFLHPDFRITVLDVGQGQASVLEFPGGATMLVDGGGFSDNEVFDVGASIVAPFLWQNKIRTIDTVLLSHPDSDHLNGLLFILKHFRVGRVISTHRPDDSDAYKAFLQIMEEKKILHPPFERIERSWSVNGTSLEILYPPLDIENACARCPGANNCSIVLRAEYSGRSVLFPGDIERCAEALLVREAGPRAASDILVAPHHGSSSSSGDAFINAVSPETVIIPVRQSRYALPSPDVLKRYRSRGCRIFRTDRDGAICIRISGAGIQIKTPAKKCI